MSWSIIRVMMPRQKRPVEAIQALGRKAIPVKTDVSNYGDVKAMVDRALQEFGDWTSWSIMQGFPNLRCCSTCRRSPGIGGKYPSERYVQLHAVGSKTYEGSEGRADH